MHYVILQMLKYFFRSVKLKRMHFSGSMSGRTMQCLRIIAAGLRLYGIVMNDEFVKKIVNEI